MKLWFRENTKFLIIILLLAILSIIAPLIILGNSLNSIFDESSDTYNKPSDIKNYMMKNSNKIDDAVMILKKSKNEKPIEIDSDPDLLQLLDSKIITTATARFNNFHVKFTCNSTGSLDAGKRKGFYYIENDDINSIVSLNLKEYPAKISGNTFEINYTNRHSIKITKVKGRYYYYEEEYKQ